MFDVSARFRACEPTRSARTLASVTHICSTRGVRTPRTPHPGSARAHSFGKPTDGGRGHTHARVVIGSPGAHHTCGTCSHLFRTSHTRLRSGLTPQRPVLPDLRNAGGELPTGPNRPGWLTGSLMGPSILWGSSRLWSRTPASESRRFRRHADQHPQVRRHRLCPYECKQPTQPALDDQLRIANRQRPNPCTTERSGLSLRGGESPSWLT